MKNIFSKIVFGTAIIALSSCSDFLDQSSPSEVTDTDAANSLFYTELTLNKVYGDLTLDATYSQYIPIVWGLNSDCEIVDGLGANATAANERGVMNYNPNLGWANLSRLWDAMYSNIENANAVIDLVDKSAFMETEGSDKNTMLRYRAEAITLRAMLYLDLIKFFGDVPMKMETTSSDLTNVYMVKEDRDVIMERLIEDLEEAILVLPWAGESGMTTERVTKGYAHSLLANIALTRAGWSIREAAKEGYETAVNSDPTYPTQRCGAEKRHEMYQLAETHLAAVVSSPVHNLNPSIENHWYLVNQRTMDATYRENIFEMPMGLGRSGELGYTVGVRINGSSDYYGLQGNSSGKMKLTAPFFYSFDENDLRRDLTCAPYELKQEDGVIKEVMQGNNPFQIYVAKWDIRKMNEQWRNQAIQTGRAKWMTGINVTRMRYSYVLLMYAEVLNELYGPDVAGQNTGMSARQALTEVHARAFADEDKAAAREEIASATDLFDAIVDENAWELAGEGIRKFDLVRWNLLSQKIEEFRNTYTTEIESTYPEKLYFQRDDNFRIIMSSVQWYQVPDVITDYESVNWYGAERTATNKTQLDVNMPSISSGLDYPVRNRHLFPIASTTISASNGNLSNSYGFGN